MSSRLDDLDDCVRQLWPRYKASIQPMWDTRLQRYSFEDLRAALWRHRADYPDDTKPVWRTIYAALTGDGDRDGTGKSDLQILLDSVRRAIAADPAWQKYPAARSWSDSEVFENHVEANVRPILRDMDGSAKDDPGGRLARSAASTRVSFVQPYIRDLEERGEPVPAWLVR